MKWIGKWKGYPVISASRVEFDVSEKEYGSCYLINEKYLIKFNRKNKGWEVVGQLEPDNSVFEYATPTPYLTTSSSSKKPKRERKEEKKKKSVEEISMDLNALSAKVDDFLNESMKSVAWEKVLFREEVG